MNTDLQWHLCIVTYIPPTLIYADMDECSYGLNNCTDNADCIDKEGGFDCQCSEGFIGNGFINCSSQYQLTLNLVFICDDMHILSYNRY